MALRNCPVCGGSDLHFFEQGLARRDANDMWFIEVTEKAIECNTCGHEVYAWYESEVEKVWNTQEPKEWEIREWNKYVVCKKEDTSSSNSNT